MSLNKRNMLAAAHVLAMDAKNLLDVVDCIRERHPTIDWRVALEDPSVLSPPFSPQPNQFSPQNTLQPSVQEEAKPDFKINQPVTTSQITTTELPKEHSSLPVTSNRVSALIHNYNLYGNIREQHIYGNSEVGGSFQHSSSGIDEKIDGAPLESVRSRIQAMSGKIDSPPIYSVSKKVIVDQNATEQG
ncbi:uncharacterized protein LOC134751120 [Cydia strobilella]|uniref:uncharacterized protein LOC134751120 n=1 Tax=Cydia strobilella TaxID=1100964 RepID=UPI003003D97C